VAEIVNKIEGGEREKERQEEEIFERICVFDR